MMMMTSFCRQNLQFTVYIRTYYTIYTTLTFITTASVPQTDSLVSLHHVTRVSRHLYQRHWHTLLLAVLALAANAIVLLVSCCHDSTMMHLCMRTYTCAYIQLYVFIYVYLPVYQTRCRHQPAMTSQTPAPHTHNGIVIAKACANWTETLPSLKSRDTITRSYIKNLLRTNVRYCSGVSESVVIWQLTLKMAEEMDFENWRISNFSWPWPWIESYGIPLCITQRPLPTYQISSESEKLFADGRTYGHLSPI